VSAIVAITATTKEIDGMQRVRLNEVYVTALAGAGLVPLIVPPLADADVDALLGAVQGLVLSGGEDVAPDAYGASDAGSDPPHRLRDSTELALARRARELRMPTLAICRGIQLANVALGGTLVQDIRTQLPSAGPHDQSKRRRERVHEITVDTQSAMARALGATQLSVNSSHHQSLDRIAAGLSVVARAPDGIVEAAEWTGDDWWMLGVQWHPEELIGTREPWDRNLFASFAAAVASRREAGV
jgi:putative glutamine amidotransferase